MLPTGPAPLQRDDPEAARSAAARPERPLDARTFVGPASAARSSADARLPAQSSQRNEFDEVAIQSGVENGVTLGTPIGFLVRNKDQRPHDYAETDLYPRPSHADWTYLAKYGIKASSGGGRSSARETISASTPLPFASASSSSPVRCPALLQAVSPPVPSPRST